jgi:hypothetical protein
MPSQSGGDVAARPAGAGFQDDRRLPERQRWRHRWSAPNPAHRVHLRAPRLVQDAVRQCRLIRGPPEKIAPYGPSRLSWGRFRGSWASPNRFHTAKTHSCRRLRANGCSYGLPLAKSGRGRGQWAHRSDGQTVNRLRAQVVEQQPRVLQVGATEPLREPGIDGAEQMVRVGVSALVAP